MDQDLTGQGRRPAPPPIAGRRPRLRPEPLTGTPPPPAPRAVEPLLPLPPRAVEPPAPRAVEWPDEPYVARWVPVPEPPPRNAAERAARTVRRLAFPLAAVGLSVAVAALVWAGRSEPYAGDPLPLPLELLAAPAAAPSPAAGAPPLRALTIETLPAGALVTVEQMPLGPSPVRTPGLADGVETLAVRVEKEGYRTLDTLLSPAREGNHTRLALAPSTARTWTDGPTASPLASAPEPVATRRAAPPRDSEPAPRRAAPTRAAEPAARRASSARAAEPAPLRAARASEGEAARTPRREAVAAAPRRDGRAPVRSRPIILERPPAPRSDAAPASARARPAPDEEPARVVVTPRRALGTVHVLVRAGGTAETGKKRPSAHRVYSADLPAGRRRIRVDHPTLGRWQQEVTVRAGEEQTIIVDMSEWARRGQ